MSRHKPLSKQSEDRILRVLDQAIDLVDNHDMHPTDAIVKAAGDADLPAYQVQLACHTYNNGRQEAQRKSHDTILEKLAEFPLADAQEAIAQLYPQTSIEKIASATTQDLISSDYDRLPDWGGIVRRKIASIAPETVLEPLPPRPKSAAVLDAEHTARIQKTLKEHARRKQAYERAHQKAAAAQLDLEESVDRLALYFKRRPDYRSSLAIVEKTAAAYYGSPVHQLFDHLVEMFRFTEKRASDAFESLPPVDHLAPPYPTIQDCLAKAQIKLAADAEATRAREDFEKFGNEHIAPLEQPDRWEDEDTLKPQLIKASGFMLGALSGSGLTRLLNTDESTKAFSDGEEKDLVNDVLTPSHMAEMANIRRQAVLAELLQDEVIRGADPKKVESTYNHLLEIAPDAMSQFATAQPWMRRSLQGAMEPFETKELLSTENAARRLNSESRPSEEKDK